VKITIEVIPHNQQRYPTAGDWQWTADGLVIKVSSLADWRHEMLVGIHEAIEAILCFDSNIAEEDVDRFDIQFEKFRRSDDVSEPGDDPRAPYHRQHRIATAIETLLAVELGVDWNRYEEEINGL
jgi:hypothetical protein